VDFIRLFVMGSILSSLTFGLYYPVFDLRRHEFMTRHAWFGNRRFGFDGRGRDLFFPFLVGMLLAFPTLGLSVIWYLARRRRYFWSHTTVGAARFRSSIGTAGLLWLYLVNAVLLIATIGLAWPWAKVRSVRFAFDNLALEGPLDLESIEQDAQWASTTGEGLAGLLDTGSGFDFG
jgi:uncharacterized membrane protein YjgN (DUF898 family)